MGSPLWRILARAAASVRVMSENADSAAGLSPGFQFLGIGKTLCAEEDEVMGVPPAGVDEEAHKEGLYGN